MIQPEQTAFSLAGVLLCLWFCFIRQLFEQQPSSKGMMQKHLWILPGSIDLPWFIFHHSLPDNRNKVRTIECLEGVSVCGSGNTHCFTSSFISHQWICFSSYPAAGRPLLHENVPWQWHSFNYLSWAWTLDFLDPSKNVRQVGYIWIVIKHLIILDNSSLFIFSDSNS